MVWEVTSLITNQIDLPTLNRVFEPTRKNKIFINKKTDDEGQTFKSIVSNILIKYVCNVYLNQAEINLIHLSLTITNSYTFDKKISFN